MGFGFLAPIPSTSPRVAKPRNSRTANELSEPQNVPYMAAVIGIRRKKGERHEWDLF